MIEQMRNGHAQVVEDRDEKIGLISYLAKLGLADADLAKAISLLPAPGKEQAVEIDQFDPPAEKPAAKPKAAAKVFDGKPSAAKQRTIKLFMAEEQQILREAYLGFFRDEAGIELVGATGDTSEEFLVESALDINPDVILLGIKTVQPATVEKLQALREACPKVAVVLLFAFYDVQGIKALRMFSRDPSVGGAYLLKHTVDSVDQITQMVYAVAEGRIIVDPMVMEGLINNGDSQASFLSELSPREMEVLSWMAKGYRNDTIADVLSRDVKTVERHINNIYSKLHHDKLEDMEEEPNSLHPRVRAALMYLRATGSLPAEQFLAD